MWYFIPAIVHLRECEERIKQQYLESTHREKVLVRRLATKEQEMQEYVVGYDVG